MRVKLLHCSRLREELIEMNNFSFDIRGLSRALLQELSRHRSGSPTVKSTRYTLKELKNRDPFTSKNAHEFLVLTGNDEVDRMSLIALNNLQSLTKRGFSNDVIKYAMPEAYKVDETITIDYYGLKNLLTLRLSKSALWEFRILANKMWKILPKDIQDKMDLEHLTT